MVQLSIVPVTPSKSPRRLRSHSVKRCWKKCAPFGLALLIVAFLIGAQPNVPARATEKVSRKTTDASAEVTTRDQMFDQLAKEVAALQPQGSLLKMVVRLAKPSVVHIEAEKTQGTYRHQKHEEAGSGVIIELDGAKYILTNRHVIRDAELVDIHIQLSDGRRIQPMHGWADPTTDVALLGVDERDLIPARIQSGEPIEIGDFVLAVGSPFGLSHSVTYGIISAKGRRDLDLGGKEMKYQEFLQTDAAINPGNSGGPLLNLRGEVIGINTAIASSSGGSEGIGFTIPIEMAMTVAQQLVEYGRTMPAYLGVQLNDRFGPNDAIRVGAPRPQGAQVTRVNPDTPAERAGLKPKDVILEVDGKRIENDEHLINVVGFTPVGKDVEIVVYRDGEILHINARVEKRNMP